MAYNPTSWRAGDKIKASKLNNMENGILEANELYMVHLETTESNGQYITRTVETCEQILAAINAGKIPYATITIEQENGIYGKAVARYEAFNYGPRSDGEPNTYTLLMSFFDADAEYKRDYITLTAATTNDVFSFITS